ncbi:MAG TPA: AraC family transcriptional regulator [Usitatibacter sp.]|nr:AraC family transcriptional regulator [Usitatibacter sp.]
MSPADDNALPSDPGAHRATVAAGFVTGMVSGLRLRGIDPRPLLQAAGVPEEILFDRDMRVPIAGYVALYNTVARHLDDEGFALFSAPMRGGSFEFLCRCVVGSRDLGEALRRGSRFLRLVLPDLEVQVHRSARVARLEIVERRSLRPEADDPSRVFAFEWLLRLLHGLSCWLAGRPLPLDAVHFPYAPPAHAADYALIYTEHSRFGGERLVATMDEALLDLPVRRDEAELAAFLEGAPGKISMLYRRDREVARRVRNMLAAALEQAHSLEDIAARLNMSSRTLHRRLHEEGTSFRAVRDGLRREVALDRLQKTTRSVADIAAELGFSEPSAFFRAFHGWTGQAPSTYRKQRGRTAIPPAHVSPESA